MHVGSFLKSLPAIWEILGPVRKIVPHYTTLLFSRQCFLFEHWEWHIIYVKSNSEEVYKKIYWFSSKIRKDRGLQSWLLWVLGKKLLKSSIIIRIHEIYYRISYTKNQGLWKTPLFWGMWNVQLLESIARRIFVETKNIFQTRKISKGKSMKIENWDFPNFRFSLIFLWKFSGNFRPRQKYFDLDKNIFSTGFF